mmetsp:Transcript_22112/g.63346  ORF Transcript_22112/g.63346 Transcript_22112/m.63346 type:complete len:225 (-) Transcript_22112:797-1471(-)
MSSDDLPQRRRSAFREVATLVEDRTLQLDHGRLRRRSAQLLQLCCRHIRRAEQPRAPRPRGLFQHCPHLLKRTSCSRRPVEHQAVHGATAKVPQRRSQYTPQLRRTLSGDLQVHEDLATRHSGGREGPADGRLRAVFRGGVHMAPAAAQCGDHSCFGLLRRQLPSADARPKLRAIAQPPTCLAKCCRQHDRIVSPGAECRRRRRQLAVDVCDGGGGAADNRREL